MKKRSLGDILPEKLYNITTPTNIIDVPPIEVVKAKIKKDSRNFKKSKS